MCCIGTNNFKFKFSVGLKIQAKSLLIFYFQIGQIEYHFREEEVDPVCIVEPKLLIWDVQFNSIFSKSSPLLLGSSMPIW